jgi:hypothetical protein
MKKIKEHFKKNGLEYTLLDRNDKVAFFVLGMPTFPDGYEVCRIYKMKPHKAFGVDFEESEKISSNDQFMDDGSGSFRDLDNALKHFDKMSFKFVRDQNVVPKSASDPEVIEEYQLVEDNASKTIRI